MYVEKEDGEMDVYFQIFKNSKTTQPRHLKMTVTVFKKHCDWADESYKPCSHSSYCVRKDFFCDGRVNCAFPYGDVGGTDEVNCNLEGKKIHVCPRMSLSLVMEMARVLIQ